MTGACRCNTRARPPTETIQPNSPNLDDWRTFGIKQDSGRALELQLHPTHDHWHFVGEGFIPGIIPGPLPEDLGDWTVEKKLTWDQAAGYMSDPWLAWVDRPNGERCIASKFKWCSHCEAVVAVPLGCHGKTCPRCWNSWANARSHKITAKVAYARRAGYTKGRPWHVMIRPPRGVIGFSWKELAAFRTKCYAIAKAHGIRGGAAVVHWGPEKDPAEPWAPHIHIIGYLKGRYVPGPTKEGWTIKFVKIGGKDGVYKNVQRVAFYELTHCVRPAERGGHAITWFGFMANNQMPNPNPEMLKAMDLDTGEGPYCPECCSKLTSMDVWDYTDPVSPVYVGSVLDGLDRPPPIITGPPDADGTRHRRQFDTWDEFEEFTDAMARGE